MIFHASSSLRECGVNSTVHLFLFSPIKTSKTEVLQMPSATEVNFMLNGFFNFDQKLKKILELSKPCEKLSKVYKKYQNNFWHAQIEVCVGRSLEK